jgi:DNA-directed RNA polymerase specialized sigma24 family protein
MNGESLLAPAPMPRPTTAPAPLLVSPEVRSAITAALRQHYVRFDDLEDLTQQVLERALRLDEPPSTLPEWVALVRKMASRLAVDSQRQRHSRSRYNAGLYENPDDRPTSDAVGSDAPEAIDARRKLDFARRQVEEGVINARAVEMLEAEADDVPQAEIARRLNVPHHVVRNELSRVRRVLRESWSAFAGPGLMAILGFLAFLLHDRSRPTLEATEVPEPNLDHTIAPVEATPEEMADALRRQALRACAVQQWVECVETLNRAEELDPAGAAKPWVWKAKNHALRQLGDKE